MRMGVMHTAEPASTQEATAWMVKILDITYVKADLKHVANNDVHLNDEERTLSLRLLEDFEDLFDGTLGEWATDPVD